MELKITHPTRGNIITIIDDEDYTKISQYNKWHVVSYKNDKKLYLKSNKRIGKRKSITFYMHRIIMDCPENKVVDHINGNTLDNRKENLRICTKSENNINRAPNKNSNHKGVSWCTGIKKWSSKIGINKKRIHLGYFDSEIKAVIAYNQASIKYHGEFARLNEVK